MPPHIKIVGPIFLKKIEWFKMDVTLLCILGAQNECVLIIFPKSRKCMQDIGEEVFFSFLKETMTMVF